MFQRIVPFLAVVGLSPLLLAACSEATSSIDPRTEVPLVRVGTVETAVHGERSFTGVVAARVQSDLGFRVPGKILERLVDTGQAVKRGQPLVRIDPTDLRLATRAHDETVAAARARARQATEDEGRYRDLVSAGAVSASTYDKIKAAAEAAGAELKAAQAQADVARNESGYTVLLADADGVVVEAVAREADSDFGLHVVLRHAWPQSRLPFYTLYGHLANVQVMAGQVVRAGTWLGALGATSRIPDARNWMAAFPHLHFEARDAEHRRYHPLDFLRRYLCEE